MKQARIRRHDQVLLEVCMMLWDRGTGDLGYRIQAAGSFVGCRSVATRNVGM
jgi:hypothetical protein